MNKAMSGPVILVVGTRPEGIKMVPLYFALSKAGWSVKICSTMQHDELLSEVFDLFDVRPDFDLKIMRMGQDLFYLTQSVLQKTKELFMREKPSLVLVQGDTTSTMAAALSAFYLNIPVGHVEAGLRTDDIQSPFPEEMNRRFVGTMAAYHFAPTPLAAGNILAQGIVARDKIFCTGNTIVDALRLVKEKIDAGSVSIHDDIKQRVAACKERGQKIIVLTAHRRESFNGGIEHILRAVKQVLIEREDIFCFYPFHPNPHVLRAIEVVGFTDMANAYVSEPISYQEMVFLLHAADVVLTDSGGMQEEAVSLAKSVLVLREKTERLEGLWSGSAQIVGTQGEKIKESLYKVLASKPKMGCHVPLVYGDGYAADKIASVITSAFVSAVSHEVQLARREKTAKCDVQKRNKTVKKICVIGLGYIGLPTALIAADHGFKVIGLDSDPKRVAKINAGDPVIYEPEVYEKLQLALGAKSFYAVTNYEPADYFIIAVPTPFQEDKKADLSHVFAAAGALVSVLKRGDVVILESTVPVGTTQKLASFLEEKTNLKAGDDFFVAHCPERVLPGKIFIELIENDRIIGGINHKSGERAKQMYGQFVRGNLYVTSAMAAEMVKLVENSSRDVQIAFAHQVASMAHAIGVNAYDIIDLANRHPRVNILSPSCGVGGHCIAIDPWFLIESFPDHSYLLRAARNINDGRPHEVIHCVSDAIKALKKNPKDLATVAVFGLTYKPDIDDVRESPALYIARELKKFDNVHLLICEPHLKKNLVERLIGKTPVSISYALEQADVVLFLVKHTRFKAIDRRLFNHKKVLDFCGMLYEQRSKSAGSEDAFWPARNERENCQQHRSHLQVVVDSGSCIHEGAE